MDSPVEFTKKIPPITIGLLLVMLFMVFSLAWTLRGLFDEMKASEARIEVLENREIKKHDRQQEQIDGILKEMEK